MKSLISPQQGPAAVLHCRKSHLDPQLKPMNQVYLHDAGNRGSMTGIDKIDMYAGCHWAQSKLVEFDTQLVLPIDNLTLQPGLGLFLCN